MRNESDRANESTSDVAKLIQTLQSEHEEIKGAISQLSSRMSIVYCNQDNNGADGEPSEPCDALVDDPTHETSINSIEHLIPDDPNDSIDLNC